MDEILNRSLDWYRDRGCTTLDLSTVRGGVRLIIARDGSFATVVQYNGIKVSVTDLAGETWSVQDAAELEGMRRYQRGDIITVLLAALYGYGD